MRAFWCLLPLLTLGCDWLSAELPPENQAADSVADAAEGPPGEADSVRADGTDQPRGAGSAEVARFGAPVKSGPTTSLVSVLQQPERYADETVVTEGHVRRACSRKGCWMEVSTEASEEAPGCRVTFRDYAFFVPTDAAGAHARVEGKVKVTRVAPQRVEHLESEGGTFEHKNDDGSATEVQLVATGVELSTG